MSKTTRQTLLSLRHLGAFPGPFVVWAVALLVRAYAWLDPTPPKRATLATGPAQSAYAEFGKRYADILTKNGIAVVLPRTEWAGRPTLRRKTCAWSPRPRRWLAARKPTGCRCHCLCRPTSRFMAVRAGFSVRAAAPIWPLTNCRLPPRLSAASTTASLFCSAIHRFGWPIWSSAWGW